MNMSHTPTKIHVDLIKKEIIGKIVPYTYKHLKCDPVSIWQGKINWRNSLKNRFKTMGYWKKKLFLSFIICMNYHFNVKWPLNTFFLLFNLKFVHTQILKSSGRSIAPCLKKFGWTTWKLQFHMWKKVAIYSTSKYCIDRSKSTVASRSSIQFFQTVSYRHN